MSVSVTVELPEELARHAQAIANQTRRRFEEVLVDWMYRAAGEPSVESLSDAEVLALSHAMMDPKDDEELSDLLTGNQEGTLQERERRRLDELMAVYRRGLVRKAQALRVAVERGLRPRLG